jgi:hypothetical protein
LWNEYKEKEPVSTGKPSAIDGGSPAEFQHDAQLENTGQHWLAKRVA